jgi:hypothetical protein
MRMVAKAAVVGYSQKGATGIQQRVTASKVRGAI